MKMNLPVLKVMLSFAAVEHVIWKSVSMSCLVGAFLKLICLRWRSSFFDKLKVNW